MPPTHDTHTHTETRRRPSPCAPRVKRVGDSTVPNASLPQGIRKHACTRADSSAHWNILCAHGADEQGRLGWPPPTTHIHTHRNTSQTVPLKLGEKMTRPPGSSVLVAQLYLLFVCVRGFGPTRAGGVIVRRIEVSSAHMGQTNKVSSVVPTHDTHPEMLFCFRGFGPARARGLIVRRIGVSSAHMRRTNKVASVVPHPRHIYTHTHRNNPQTVPLKLGEKMTRSPAQACSRLNCT